jgi:hypothetical protein
MGVLSHKGPLCNDTAKNIAIMVTVIACQSIINPGVKGTGDKTDGAIRGLTVNAGDSTAAEYSGSPRIH